MRVRGTNIGRGTRGGEGTSKGERAGGESKPLGHGLAHHPPVASICNVNQSLLA